MAKSIQIKHGQELYAQLRKMFKMEGFDVRSRLDILNCTFLALQ